MEVCLVSKKDGGITMINEVTYNGKKLIDLHLVSKTFAGYGQWTLFTEFKTEDNEWHRLSAHCTDARLIDKWVDAIADDDTETLDRIKRTAVEIILDKN